MEGNTQEGADLPEPAGQRVPFFWGGRSPRGLAFAALTLIGGSVAVLALHGGGAIRPRYQAVDVPSSVPQTADDPLMNELVRCRALPSQATDPACERAWDENRRRFFGDTRATRVPGDPQPQYAPIPDPAGVAVVGPPPSLLPKDH